MRTVQWRVRKGDRMWKAILSVVGILILVAHANATELTGDEETKIKSEIETEVQKILAAANALDSNNIVSSFSSSPDFQFVKDGVVISGREATEELTKGYSNMRSQDISQDMRVLEQHTAVLAPDLAVYTARCAFTLTAQSRKTSEIPLAATILWRRESGMWRVLNIHESIDLLAKSKR
jgi:uncharacterized protein (TIGR02246 family)